MKGVLVGIGSAVLGIEIWGWLPLMSRALIWLETLCLPRERRMLRREEWRGELEANYAERRLAGLLWAFRLAPLCLWERATTNTERRTIAAFALSSKSLAAIWTSRRGALNRASSTIQTSYRLGSELLAFLGGADIRLLAMVPSERPRFTALGGVNVIGGALVAFTTSTFMCEWLNVPLAAAALIGIVGCAVSCVLQRQLMILPRARRRSMFVVQMMPRLCLDICLGLLVGESLVLGMFRPDLLGTGPPGLKHHMRLGEAMTTLQHLVATNPSLESAKLLLTAFIIAMMTAPALMSMTSALGRPTLYEAELDRLMIEP